MESKIPLMFAAGMFMAALVASQEFDPILDMCARWDHQSTLKDGYLYVDGGVEMFNYGVNDDTVLGFNKYIIQVDMSDSWDWETNISQRAIPKLQNEDTMAYPPSVIRGSLFQGPADDSRIYLFGGTISYYNSSFVDFVPPSPDTYALWSYDTVSQEWESFDVTTVAPLRPNYGAYTEAPDQNLAFWFNGQVDKGSDGQTETFAIDQTMPLDDMLILDLATPTVTNVSTTAVTHGTPRVGAGLQYVPGLGERGILAQFGGQTHPGNVFGAMDKGQLIDFEMINIFDIAAFLREPTGDGAWYSQKATGDIPRPRTQFCLVYAAAPDGSSHNIYLYGGLDETSGEMYDQIYALSLPSFTWINIFHGQSPRWGHTCHLVGNRQMLTVGGSLSIDLKECDWETAGVAIYDLAEKGWGSNYDAYAAEYKVTPDIVANIGGSPSGGATVTAPADGYSQTALASVMSATPFAATGQATEPQTSTKPAKQVSGSGTDIALIVGASVGGGVASVAIIGGIVAWILIRRRRRRRRASNATDTPAEHVEPTSAVESQRQGFGAGELNPDTLRLEAGSDGAQYEIMSRKPRVELDADDFRRAELAGWGLDKPPRIAQLDGGRRSLAELMDTSVLPDDGSLLSSNDEKRSAV